MESEYPRDKDVQIAQWYYYFAVRDCPTRSPE